MACPDRKARVLAALALIVLAGAVRAQDGGGVAAPTLPEGSAATTSVPLPPHDEPDPGVDELGPTWRRLTWPAPAPNVRPAPPRARALEPAGPHSTYVLNLAALAANPLSAGDAFRVELGVEQRLPQVPRVTSAVLVAAGRVAVSGYDAALALELAGQFRFYALGDLPRGLYFGGHLGFWRIGDRYLFAPGALAGVKLVGPRGVSLDLQACAEWPADTFAVQAGPRQVPTRDAWRALAPGLMLGVGFSRAGPPPAAPAARPPG